MENKKRDCKVCGKVHLHCPFTDCCDLPDSQLPNSLEDGYKKTFLEDWLKMQTKKEKIENFTLTKDGVFLKPTLKDWNRDR